TMFSSSSIRAIFAIAISVQVIRIQASFAATRRQTGLRLYRFKLVRSGRNPWVAHPGGAPFIWRGGGCISRSLCAVPLRRRGDSIAHAMSGRRGPRAQGFFKASGRRILPPLAGKGGDERRPAGGGPYAIARVLAIARRTPQQSCGWAHRSPLAGGGSGAG